MSIEIFILIMDHIIEGSSIMKIRTIVKVVVGFIASTGASFIVEEIISNNTMKPEPLPIINSDEIDTEEKVITPEPEFYSKYRKVTVAVGTIVISSMVGLAASKYTDSLIDDVANIFCRLKQA